MNKLILLFAFFAISIMSFGQLRLTLGEPVRHVMITDHVGSICSMGIDNINLSFDTNSVPIASGVELYLVFTHVKLSSSDMFNQGMYKVGDSIHITKNISSISISVIDTAAYTIDIVAEGIPTVGAEMYACKYQIMATLAECNNTHYIRPYIQSNNCKVAIPDKVETDYLKHFSSYPSPAKDQITIEFEKVSSLNHVEIFNVSGELLNSFTLPQDNKINVGNLNAGVYLLKISNASSVYYSKIIKQ